MSAFSEVIPSQLAFIDKFIVKWRTETIEILGDMGFSLIHLKLKIEEKTLVPASRQKLLGITK